MLCYESGLSWLLLASVIRLHLIIDQCDALRENSRDISSQRVVRLKDKDAELEHAFRKLRMSFVERHIEHHTLHSPASMVTKSTTSSPEEGLKSHLRGQTLLQTSKAGESVELVRNYANSSEDVLFTVWTDSKFYDTRLTGILRTWGKELPRERFMAVSDKKRVSAHGDEPGTQVEETRCPPHSHWEGACCKWAEGVILAQRRMESNPKLKWAFFSDDDVYLRPSAVATALRSYETSQPLALGIFGCSTAGGCQGLCGGGGFAMNRAAVQRMADEDPVTFLQEEMGYCQKCEKWADQAISMIWRDKGVEMRQLPGLHGWKMKDTDFQEQLSNGSPNLLFHYQPNINQMESLHELFTGEKLLSVEDGPCAEFEGRRACAASSNPSDTPFEVSIVDL